MFLRVRSVSSAFLLGGGLHTALNAGEGSLLLRRNLGDLTFVGDQLVLSCLRVTAETRSTLLTTGILSFFGTMWGHVGFNLSLKFTLDHVESKVSVSFVSTWLTARFGGDVQVKANGTSSIASSSKNPSTLIAFPSKLARDTMLQALFYRG